jgi:hypothetical protein
MTHWPKDHTGLYVWQVHPGPSSQTNVVPALPRAALVDARGMTWVCHSIEEKWSLGSPLSPTTLWSRPSPGRLRWTREG